MSIDTQILKGLLEGCLLKIIEKEEIYGYKAVERLNEIGFDVNEATVYPILTRLTNKGILRVEKRPSPYGPERKYYFITDMGKTTLQEFDTTWQHIQNVVNQVMDGEEG